MSQPAIPRPGQPLAQARMVLTTNIVMARPLQYFRNFGDAILQCPQLCSFAEAE